MATTELMTRLTRLLEPAAAERGFELVAVEQAGGRRTPVIRVLLDRPEGITIDAICAANAWIGEILDQADPISGPYTLEVSSPGVDRPLTKLADFDRFAGETASVKARVSGGRASWTGVIAGTDGTTVLLDVDGEQVRVPFDDILKARLKGVVRFDRGRDEPRDDF